MNTFYQGDTWGIRLKVTGKGQGCVAAWISDSIFWLVYFTPRWLVGVMPCPRKSLKNYTKEKKQQIREEDVSFILSFIYWVQQTFHEWGSFSWIHWNGWIPQLRCQKYIKSFHVCICPHLVCRVSIRVSFLLEVLSKSSKGKFVVPLWVSIFQHNAGRERAATGWKGLTIATSKDVVPRYVSNDVIKTLVTAWKRKIIWSPLSRGCLFSFTHASSPFPVRDLWEFLQI